MVLLLVSMAHTEWRWADDTSEFTMDKQGHFVGSYGLYFMFRHKDFSELDSFKYSLYCGIAKEVLDAYNSHKKYNVNSGDGFSKYDLFYNLLGIGTGYIIDNLWKKKPFDIKFNLYQY